MRVGSRDGEWTIDVINLTLTGTHRDGQRLRVARWGWFIAELRTVEELANMVDLAELEEVGLPRISGARWETSTL